jgi:hypothetical protein
MMNTKSILLKASGDISIQAGGKVRIPKGKLDDKTITSE